MGIPLIKDIAETSGFFYRRKMAVAEVLGGDALSFLQGLATQNIREITDPAKARILFPKSNGKIVFDAYAEKIEAGYRLYLLPENFELAQKYLDFFHVREDIEFHFPPPTANLCFVLGKLEKKEGGALYSKPDGKLSVFPDLPLPRDFLELGNETEYDSVRACFAMTEIKDCPDSYPAELGMADCVSYDKGCYVGQEPIARMQFKGKVRKAIHQVVSNAKLEKGERIKNGEAKAGEVLLASEIPAEGKFHALALIKTAIAESGERPTLRAGETEVDLA